MTAEMSLNEMKKLLDEKCEAITKSESIIRDLTKSLTQQLDINMALDKTLAEQQNANADLNIAVARMTAQLDAINSILSAGTRSIGGSASS